MTDPIDPALLPCPFCGASRASIHPVRDGRVVICPACGAQSGSQFHGPSAAPSADQRAIAAWNTRDASQADTTRREGIVLGLAMAAGKAKSAALAQIQAACSNGDSWYTHDMEGAADDVAEAILALATIPPHVAAARVLLDDLRLALSFGASPDALAAGGRWSKAHDAAESAPTSMSRPTPIQMIRAALEQIAKEAE